MAGTNFTADATVDGRCRTKDLQLVANGTWGGGTLTLSIYSYALQKYVVVDSWTADTAQEIVMGAGTRYRLALSSSTSPDLDVIHEPIHSGVR